MKDDLGYYFVIRYIGEDETPVAHSCNLEYAEELRDKLNVEFAKEKDRFKVARVSKSIFNYILNGNPEISEVGGQCE